MRILLCLTSVFILAAAPAPDPVLEKVLAGARAVPPASIAFERTSRSTGTDGKGASETHVRVDRWDGRNLVTVSIDGKTPTPEQAAKAQKAAQGRPVPGYHRLADVLKGRTERSTDAQGRAMYRVTGLPKGSVNIGRDISQSLVAEALVETNGTEPYVSKMRVYLPKPLSFLMVAKLDTFEIVNEYRLGPGGRPALVKSSQSLSGAQFGKIGTSRTESSYSIMR